MVFAPRGKTVVGCSSCGRGRGRKSEVGKEVGSGDEVGSGEGSSTNSQCIMSSHFSLSAFISVYQRLSAFISVNQRLIKNLLFDTGDMSSGAKPWDCIRWDVRPVTATTVRERRLCSDL